MHHRHWRISQEADKDASWVAVYPQETLADVLTYRSPRPKSEYVSEQYADALIAWLVPARVRYHHIANRLTVRSESTVEGRAMISIAICSTHDQFCKRVGRAICERRANQGHSIEVRDGKAFIQKLREQLYWGRSRNFVTNLLLAIHAARVPSPGPKIQQPDYVPASTAKWLTDRGLVALPAGTKGGPGIRGVFCTNSRAPEFSCERGWQSLETDVAGHQMKQTQSIIVLWRDK